MSPFEKKVERVYKQHTPYPKRTYKKHVKADVGTSRDKVINYYRRTIDIRMKRINRLVDKLKEKEGIENELKKQFRRELRKKDTLYKNLEKKFESFKERKGQRHRTVVHKVKYKTYQPSKKIERFEDTCNTAKTLHQDTLGFVEYKLKTKKFINESPYKGVTEEHLFILTFLLILGRPFTIKDISNLDGSDSIKRGIIKVLESYLLVVKKTPRIYEVTALGKSFVNDYKNFLSYGKSELFEEIKNIYEI